MSNLNEQQFSLFDPGDYAIEHPGQLRRGAWQGQDDIMWHGSNVLPQDRGSVEWETGDRPSHAGTLSAAAERMSGRDRPERSVVWPLRPVSRRFDNTPDDPEIDLLANLASDPDYREGSSEELLHDPTHGPAISKMFSDIDASAKKDEVGLPTDLDSVVDEKNIAINRYVDEVTPQYQEGLYYHNVSEDIGSMSLVAPSRNLRTHYDDVQEASDAGLVVQPAVRAEAEHARRKPVQFEDVSAARQTDPQIVGNVGGDIGFEEYERKATPINPWARFERGREVPTQSRIVPVSEYDRLSEYSESASNLRDLYRQRDAIPRPPQSDEDKMLHHSLSQGIFEQDMIAHATGTDLHRATQEFWSKG